MDSLEKKGRPPGRRDVQRFPFGPSPVETSRQQKEADEKGRKRVKDYWPSLVQIQDGDVRLALTDIVRAGNVQSFALNKLLSSSEKVPRNTVSLINLLKNQRMGEKLHRIEEALKIDLTDRMKYDTRKQTRRILASKEQPPISLDDYGRIVHRLYNILLEAFSTEDLSPEKGMTVFKDAKMLIVELDELEEYAQGLLSRDFAKDLFFGDELNRSGGDASKRLPPPPLPQRPTRRP